VTSSDDKLMKDYIEGNLESFHLLYSRIAPRWFAVVQSHAHSAEEQEKLFLWLFEQIHQARMTYVAGQDLDDWIRQLIGKSHRAALSTDYGVRLSPPEMRFTEVVLDWINEQILPPAKTVLLRYYSLFFVFALLVEVLLRVVFLLLEPARDLVLFRSGDVSEAFLRGTVMGLMAFGGPMFFLTRPEKLALRETRVWSIPLAVIGLVIARMIWVFSMSGVLSLPLPMTAWAVGLLLGGRMASNAILRTHSNG